MKANCRMTVMTAAALGVMTAAAGCAPRMAQTELSPEEAKWAAYISDNYSAWEKPQTIPSGVRRTDISETTVVNVDEATGATTGVTKETSVTGYGETTVVSRVTEPNQTEASGAVVAVAVAEEPAAEVPATPEAGEAVTAEAGEKAPAEAAAADKTPAEPEIYTVQKGDSLGGIALKHYGKASAWTKIQKANEDILKGKTVIRPGMKLVLPKL